MSLNRYNPHSRYRQRAAQRNHKLIVSLIVGAGLFAFGFWMGRQHVAFQITSLKKETEIARADVKKMQDDLIKVRAENQTVNSRFEQLQTQYQQDLPEEGPTRELVQMLRKQLADGMPPERLSFVIKSVRPPRNCSDPSSKRFMVKTPAYTGPDSAASIAEGAVSVSGTGLASRNKDGQQEAWFDPSQQVAINFKISGGEVERKVGTLPLQHSLIAAGREYRFTLSEGEKSFIKVTFDSCDYP